MTSAMDYLKAYPKVIRAEYIPAELPAVFLALILGATVLTDIIQPWVFEAFLIFVLMIFAGFIVNSMTDRDIDKKYNSFKGKVSDGVDVYGQRGMEVLLWSHVMVAFIMGVHLSWWMNDPMFLVILSIGAFFGIGYSLKPFHFKVRGWLHVVSLGLSGYFIPFVFLYYSVALSLDPVDVLFISCFTVAHYALALTNQSADAKEDADEGLRTPAVRWGLSRTLLMSKVGTVIGVTMATIMLYYFFITGLPMFTSYEGVEAMNPFLAVGMLSLVTVIMAMAYYFPLRGQSELHRISRMDLSEEEKSRRIKDRINFHTWHASGISGAVVCLVIFLGVGWVLTPADDDAGAGDGDASPLTMSIGEVWYTESQTAGGGKWADVTVEVVVNGTPHVEPGEYTLTGRSIFKGEELDTNSTNLGGDWTAVMGFAIHDSDDTAFDFDLAGPEGRIETRQISSKVDLYIADDGIREPQDLLDHTEVEVTVWNDGPPREAETVTVTLTVNRLVGTMPDVSQEKNADALPRRGEWTVAFPLDRPETAKDYTVTVEYNGRYMDLTRHLIAQ